MEVTRSRFGSLLEWAVAAFCVITLLVAGSWTLTQLHRAPAPIVPVAAKGMSSVAMAPAPAAIPPKAVAVPFILLSSGSELRVGDAESTAAGALKTAWRVGDDAFERTTRGNRITRAYDDGAQRFLIVLDPPAGPAERRVSAIYVR